jgi:PASTA domain
VPSEAQGVPQEEHKGADRERPGSEEVKVPGEVGLTEQEARRRLADAGFEIEVRYRESSAEDTGKVLEQSIPGGKVGGGGFEYPPYSGQGSRARKGSKPSRPQLPRGGEIN